MKIFVNGAVQWTAPPNLGMITVGYFDSQTGKGTLSGDPQYSYSAQTTHGRVIPNLSAYAAIDGDVAMSQNPPKVKLKQ